MPPHSCPTIEFIDSTCRRLLDSLRVGEMTAEQAEKTYYADVVPALRRLRSIHSELRLLAEAREKKTWT